MERRRRISARGVRTALAIAACAGVAIGAAPARAGDEFERGFKRELGRIAAHEAVLGGRHVLAAVLLGHHPYHTGHRGHVVRHEHYHYPAHPYPRGYGYYDHDDDSDSDSDSDRRYRRRRHHRHHDRHACDY